MASTQAGATLVVPTVALIFSAVNSFAEAPIVPPVTSRTTLPPDARATVPSGTVRPSGDR